jgi:hypothetical protein
MERRNCGNLVREEALSITERAARRSRAGEVLFAQAASNFSN